MVGAIGFTLIRSAGAETKEIVCPDGDIMLTHIGCNTGNLPVRALTDNPVGNPTAVKLSGLSEPAIV